MKEQNTGKFITLEGGDGVGKTTNLKFIEKYLDAKGVEVLLTREPGGTALGESVRGLLLDTEYNGMHPDCELLLVFAARAEHINSVIIPAISKGVWVLSDRFTDASFAYQGSGREMGFSLIEKLETIVQKGFQPDLTLLLDADIELGQTRVLQRKSQDRFEQEQLDFFTRVRDGYLRRASSHRDRIKIINAMQTLEHVQMDIVMYLERLAHAK